MSTDAPNNAGRGRKPRPKAWQAIGLIVLLGLCIFGIAYARGIVDEIARKLPKTPDPATVAVSTEVVDRHGLLLRPFTTDGRWRLPVTSAQVDRRFIDMLIAYEDERFEDHHAIDWSGMARAAVQFTMAGGHIVSGGSTLTMQVARLLETGSTRSLDAKIRQMVHADKLESELSKEQILTLYLTLAPYGGNIEGVRAASLAYFGKEPKRLTLGEAALLVALPQSPELRRPDRHAEAAHLARARVLDRAAKANAVPRDEIARARNEPVPHRRKPMPVFAPHSADA